MTTSEIIEKAKFHYTNGQCYFTFEINGTEAKVRMNKDHGRNHGRNDDEKMHNLSLVSIAGNGINERNSYFINETRKCLFVQKQVWGVTEWSDVEREILEFIEEIEFENK